MNRVRHPFIKSTFSRKAFDVDLFAPAEQESETWTGKTQQSETWTPSTKQDETWTDN